MADVSISYQGETIAELDTTGTRTLKTGGCFCEGDVAVTYAPRSRTYEITLPRSFNWFPLVTLDEDVLEHIDDAGFTAMLVNTSPYEYVWYSGSYYLVTNQKHGTTSEGDAVYGMGSRLQSESHLNHGYIIVPANNRNRESSVAYPTAWFLLENGQYWLKPGDGEIRPGVYRLTFAW